MKSASEWLDSEQWHEQGYKEILEQIESIQLDSYKAGLKAAADECYLINIHGTSKIMNGSSDEIRKRILTLHDKITELPKE